MSQMRYDGGILLIYNNEAKNLDKNNQLEWRALFPTRIKTV